MSVSNLIRKCVFAVSQNNSGIKYSLDYGETWLNTDIISGSFLEPIYNDKNVIFLPKSGENTGVYYYPINSDSPTIELTKSDDLGDKLFISGKLLNDDFGGVIITDSDGVNYTSSEYGTTWNIVELSSKYEFSSFEESNDVSDIIISDDQFEWIGRDLMKVFKCDTLPELCQILRNKSENRDYSGLRLGDYFESWMNPVTKVVMTKYVICGFGVYDGIGDTDSGPGILFQALNTFNKRMHSSDNNSNKFTATELGSYFSGSLLPAYENVLGVSLRTVRRYYDIGWSAEKLFLPTESEVFGSHHRTASEVGQSSTSVIWPIFNMYPNSRLKKGSTENSAYNSVRSWWWTCTKSLASGAYTAADLNGDARGGTASNGNGGVAPAFYL